MTKQRARRKVKEGTVVSNKMQKTVIVSVSRTCAHPQYGKIVTRRKKYYAHYDGDKELKVGDQVKIMETRPISKTKCWRVVESS